MTPDILTGLALFAFVSTFTPGPNNLMLMASGANFGFRRTLPHMLGITVGVVVMILVVGGGLVQVFDAYPSIYEVLRVASVVYLLFLAWKIGTASNTHEKALTGSPMTFLQAAAFQWVNPKAWAMALTAISVYIPAQTTGAVLFAAAMFGAVSLPSVSSWTVLGQQLARLLTSPVRLRVFNWTMAGLLVASLYPVILPG